jgi:hypothetical protein
VTLNGEAVERPQVRHGEIMAGGVLRFEMGPLPNRAWGEAGTTPLWDPPDVVATPAIHTAAPSFVKRTEVRITAAAGTTIHYTLDGTDPSPRSTRYEGPIRLEDSTEIRAIAVRDGRASPPVVGHVARRPGDWRVTLGQTYNRQYTAGGPEGLVDGLRGSTRWRAGRWQGYQGTDVEAVVDLGRTRTLNRVGAGFLQDARAWIWFPTEVEVAVSRDGKRFTSLGTVKADVAADDMEIRTKDLWIDAGKRRARHVRLRAKTLGPIPEWHPGRGNPAFIFIDEILVE